MQIGEPPESKRKPSANWITKATLLKGIHSGEYGMVGNFSVGVATHIRQGDYPAFLPNVSLDPEQRRDYMESHWIVTTRRTPDGRNDVYVKWIGQGCTCGNCNEAG